VVPKTSDIVWVNFWVSFLKPQIYGYFIEEVFCEFNPKTFLWVNIIVVGLVISVYRYMFGTLIILWVIQRLNS
jgi:hypothetical protein